MHDAGLTQSLCDDDPGMFPTTLNNEYEVAHSQIGLTPEELAKIVLNDWRAAWVPADETTRRTAEAVAALGGDRS